MPETVFPSLDRIHPRSPAAVCFLFNTAFSWLSGSGKTPFSQCPLRPDSKKVPRKIRYALPVACQGAGPVI
jgi:hypothetical protein